MAKLMNALYKEINDEYEVVIFVGNRLDNIRSYDGMAQYISNNEPELKFSYLLICRMFWIKW